MKRGNSACFPPLCDRSQNSVPVPQRVTHGKFPDATDDQSLADIEVSRRTIKLMVEGIGVYRTVVAEPRLVINRVGVGVRATEIEVVAESLIHRKLELVAARGAAAQVGEQL